MSSGWIPVHWGCKHSSDLWPQVTCVFQNTAFLENSSQLPESAAYCAVSVTSPQHCKSEWPPRWMLSAIHVQEEYSQSSECSPHYLPSVPANDYQDCSLSGFPVTIYGYINHQYIIYCVLTIAHNNNIGHQFLCVCVCMFLILTLSNTLNL